MPHNCQSVACFIQGRKLNKELEGDNDEVTGQDKVEEMVDAHLQRVQPNEEELEVIIT